MGEDRLNAKRQVADWDAAALLKFMWESRNDVFRKTPGPAECSLLSELRDHRNKWAHQQTFSSDEASRALDSAGRLLTAVSAPQADEFEKMKLLLRLRFDEQVRGESGLCAGSARWQRPDPGERRDDIEYGHSVRRWCHEGVR
jgi:hypothetical protein